jgi:polar amino acid transport system substrate-binding protein
VTRRTLLPVLVAFALMFGVVACGAGSNDATGRATDALTPPPTTTAPPATTARANHSCDATASYPPLAPLPSTAQTQTADAVMRDLVDRGKLVVAVDENTQGLASRDPDTGELVGLEIELAKLIAQRIFGGELGDHVQFKTVTTKEKIEFPKEGKVDLSISAISVTCERWNDVAFSSEYFHALHAFLVRDDSTIREPGDVAGTRVCMTKGSTSVGILDGLNKSFRRANRPVARPVLVDARTDCLVDLQEGTVDAYLGHDTFLVGMVDQDPNLRIVKERHDQHYGIAIGKDHTYFVQYVNGVLEELRENGALRDLYGPVNRLFEHAHIEAKVVPAANPNRPLP